MVKVEKNVAVVLSAEDVMAMNRTASILYAMADAIEDSGVELSEKDEGMLTILADTADTISQIPSSLKGGKFEWTLSEELATVENISFSWH